MHASAIDEARFIVLICVALNIVALMSASAVPVAIIFDVVFNPFSLSVPDR